MIDILQNNDLDNLMRIDVKVKVTNPITTIKTGSCCKLDANKEVVKTGYAINWATGTNAQPFAPGTGVSDKLSIKVDGGAAQTITLAATDTTAALVVTKINATLTGAVASVTTDNKVKITSSTARGSIELVTIANNAYAVLGFTVGKSNDYVNVYWAFTSANDADEDRGDFRMTGKITLLKGVFLGETDQYDANESYTVTGKLTSENGLLIPAGINDYVCARVTKPPVGGKLQILTLARPAVA